MCLSPIVSLMYICACHPLVLLVFLQVLKPHYEREALSKKFLDRLVFLFAKKILVS